MLTKCPACRMSVEQVANISTLHFTGDERIISLYDCPACRQSWLDDWVDAWLDRGTEVVERAFGPLQPGERERVGAAFAACPAPNRKGCRCGADEIADQIIGRLAQVSLRVEPGKPTPTHSC